MVQYDVFITAPSGALPGLCTLNSQISESRTPNMDRLHDEGVRFTDFHVSPTCSPTRSALLTGRHEFKNGVTHTIYERERLTLKATTLAARIKTLGIRYERKPKEKARRT